MSICGHSTCIGPVCTVQVSPKKPLTGVSRERAALLDEITLFLSGSHVSCKRRSSGVLISFWTLPAATAFVSEVRRVMDGRQEWTARAVLWADFGVTNSYYVKVAIKKREA